MTAVDRPLRLGHTPPSAPETALAVIPRPELKLPATREEYMRWLRFFNSIESWLNLAADMRQLCTCAHTRDGEQLYGGFHLRGNKAVCNTCGRLI
jgi:hypothetical protein